ncbi:hypothetical protein DSL72_003152 [Monilinia vaccinii-corymbosi]|uniref:Autophagy-related protein 27 n=1 Tax=Monilinia vaccinii-corymbosi TaxID=61207 RepID=A0A8A3NT73_9HELO|nr:hypothetical protein DSL72_003152 [Monilinia vaccinii-corymbosi]
MRPPWPPTEAAFLSALLFPLLSAALGNLDCKNIVVDGKPFNLGALGGPRSALHSIEDYIGDEAKGWTNTTYTVDICQALVKKGFNECPSGTRVCGITHVINESEGSDATQQIVPFAGELQNYGGGPLDAKLERLSNSKAHADADKEGLRVELGGGFIGRGKNKRPQKAIVEFICDVNRTGLENLWVPPEPKHKEKQKQNLHERGDNDGNEVIGAPSNDSSLQFLRLDKDKGDADILRLTWRTKYACEDGPKDNGENNKSSHWGFFTWFIIVVFLSIAAYLVFGSWLNYDRYGARGWDLLPHGDTIRDVPYLLKDWSRRVLSTVQDGGSRGGYAAV